MHRYIKDNACPEGKENCLLSMSDIMRVWQDRMTRIMYLYIIASFAVEMILMFVMNVRNTIEIPLRSYVIFLVLFPTILNLGCLFIWIWMRGRWKDNQARLNYYSIVLFSIMLSNLIIVHCIFPIVYGVLVIPLFMTIVFGNLHITKRCFHFIVGLYVVDMGLVTFALYPYYLTESYIFNMVISFVMLPVGYMIVRFIVQTEESRAQLVLQRSVENAKLRAEVEVDDLTSIMNYSGFFRTLDESVARWKAGKTLNLAVLDIDFFKQVNDDFGHDAGNQVLQRFGALLTDISSNRVCVARYGGEEFAIIFTDMNDNVADRILNYLAEKFASQTYDGIDRQITFSAGITNYEEGMEPRDFFRIADRALYISKRSGRNRITRQ